MDVLRTLCLGLAVAGAALVGVLCGGPPPYPEGDARRVTLADWLAAGPRRERLAEDRREMARSRQAVRQVVLALIEGRCTLPEAAAALRAENDARPPHRRTDLRHLPGATAEERFCHSALDRARGELEDDPRQEEVLRRLEAELEAYLARAGEAPRAE